MISSTIVLTNSNNKLEGLATYNGNGIQPLVMCNNTKPNLITI